MGDLHQTVTPGVIPGAARVLMPGTVAGREPLGVRSHGMDGIRDLLEAARARGLVVGKLRGLFHIVIGRRVTRTDGTQVSVRGTTWRELAGVLKLLRFDKELVRELGADPEDLAPRDRGRFWYSAIALAKVDSPEAVAQAESLIGSLKELGYVVGPVPAGAAPHAVTSTPPKAKPAGKAKPPEPKPAPKKKRK